MSYENIAYIELSANGVRPVRLECEPDPNGGARLYFLRAGITGWYSSPDLKVSSIERGNGDGAHDVPESVINYASRTVQVHVGAMGRDRGETLRLWANIQRFAHRMVKLRLVDDSRDAYVMGMCQWEGPAEWEPDYMEGVLTVVCQRPEILASHARLSTLMSDDVQVGGGGLSYNQSRLSTWWTGAPNDSPSVLKSPSLAGVKGLRYPLTYRTTQVADRSNQCVLVNNGTSKAYPVFTVNGPMPDGVDLVIEGTGLWLRCLQPVQQVPLVLDCRSRTATVAGLDVSRMLKSRGFPTIPPGGSITVTLRTTGKGWVTAQVRDTWM